MHSHRVAHRDLKPSNLLLSFEPDTAVPVLKIADLGMGRVVCSGVSTYTRECTTLAYRSPEVLLGAEDYDPKALDVWSVGCIVAELVDAYSLFRTTSASPTQFEALMMIFRLCGTPDEVCVCFVCDALVVSNCCCVLRLPGLASTSFRSTTFIFRAGPVAPPRRSSRPWDTACGRLGSLPRRRLCFPRRMCSSSSRATTASSAACCALIPLAALRRGRC